MPELGWKNLVQPSRTATSMRPHRNKWHCVGKSCQNLKAEMNLCPAAQWTNISQQCKLTVPQDLAVTQQVIRLDQIKIGQNTKVHCLLAHNLLLLATWARTDVSNRSHWRTNTQLQAKCKLTGTVTWRDFFFFGADEGHVGFCKNNPWNNVSGKTAVNLLKGQRKLVWGNTFIICVYQYKVNIQQRCFEFQRRLGVCRWMSFLMTSSKIWVS